MEYTTNTNNKENNMNYKANLQNDLQSLETLKSQLEELKSKDSLEKHTVSMYDMIRATNIVDKMKTFNVEQSTQIRFKSVNDCITDFFDIYTFSKQIDDILETANFYTEMYKICDKINTLIDNSPYLNDTLKEDIDVKTQRLSNEVLKEVINFSKYKTPALRKNLAEAAIRSVSIDELPNLVNAHLVVPEILDHISIEGDKEYKDKIDSLCTMLCRDKITIKKYKNIRLKGVTFEGRQENIKLLSEANPDDRVLTVKPDMFKTPAGIIEPSVEIKWNDKSLGFLAKQIAQEIYDRQKVNSSYEATFKEVVGGGDVCYGLAIDFTDSFLINPSDKENEEEKAR